MACFKIMVTLNLAPRTITLSLLHSAGHFKYLQCTHCIYSTTPLFVKHTFIRPHAHLQTQGEACTCD